jgi:peptidyl-prolyl cis-trans isomerase B (cyclophilin B)
MQPQPPPQWTPFGEPGPPAPPARPNRTWLWIVLGAVAALVLVCVVGGALLIPAARHHFTAARPAASSGQPSTGAASGANSGNGAATDCAYQSSTDAGGRKAPVPPAKATASGKVRVTLATSQGNFVVDLDADNAPCTVNSFLSLTRSGYYDNTPCHRLTTSGIFVLQCGDPSGNGDGGPGYRFSDENLPTDQHPAYPRGTVAMANAGPGTNGSQFFLVYADSDIDPNYTVFGTITGGLDVLDKVAQGGTDDTTGSGDGHPKLAVTVRSVKVN